MQHLGAKHDVTIDWHRVWAHGTDSMRLALDQLGFGPTHHMHVVNENEAQRTLWRGIANGAAPHWGAVFDGFQSCLDWPSAHYWRALIAHFPAAKVLLTLRSAESWWESFSKTILPRIMDPDAVNLGRVLIAEQVFSGRPDDRAHAIKTFNDNTNAVLATVPAERLLVFEIGAGWAPLCQFLNCDIPPTPFPRVNAADEFNRRQDKAPD